MSAKLVVTCDGCGQQITIAPQAAQGTQSLAIGRFALPPGWIGTADYPKPPYMLHACKPACRAVVELKFFTEDI